MQRLTYSYVVSMNCYAVLTMWCVCTNLAPRPMTVVFGLGTKLRLRMHTRLENGVLHNV